METGVTIRVKPARKQCTLGDFSDRHLQGKSPLRANLPMDVWGCGGERAGEGKRQSGVLEHSGFGARIVYHVLLKTG